MTFTWQPYRESLLTTLARTVTIALVVGAVLALGSGKLSRWPARWLGGLAFIGVELVAQLVLQLRGRPSFYNGRG